MIELPESQTLAKQIKSATVGRIIEFVQAAQSLHGFAWYNGNPANYPDMLNGKRVDGARPIGGQVEIIAGDMRLVFNDGINIRHVEPGGALPAKHQLYIRFDDGSGIICTVQMYGGMVAFPAGTYDNFYYRVACEKPTPLDEAFDEAYFGRIVAEAGPKLSVKALLATEQRIPGLGNGCLHDILFNARLNPQTKLGTVSDAELEALFSSVKTTLLNMTLAGGRDT